jgi:subtilisin family serine protease/subtilisin-like proprotein convertase family protein
VNVVSARRLAALTAVAAIGGSVASAAAAPPGLGEKAAGQIAALQEIKRSLAPRERKLDSRLAVALRQRRDRSVPAATPKLTTGVTVSKSGGTAVDVRATAVTADLLARLYAVGASVDHASKRLDSVRAEVPLSALPEVASWADVRKVDVATEAITHVVSEGDKAHAADLARTRHRVTGTGVKVCVLSDGVDSLAASQAAGELPDVDVLPGEEGDGDEGTAMLEIVHDVAPNAELGFATALTSDASFADNIRALRFEAGCDILVDDVLYFNEHPFQDGPIAQAVNAVTADGALFFSSAGNEGNTIDGTAGNYEGDFIDSGRSVGKFAGVAHDFDPGPGVQVFEPISPQSSANVPVTLFWADPLGGAANDYDLYLFDANENIVAFSQDVQNGDDDPYEILGTPVFGGSGLRLAVVRFSGTPRYFQLSALRGRFENSTDGLIARETAGVTRGHSAAADAFSTAAVPAAAPLPRALEPGDPPNPAGPFPNPFTAAQLPERFTSDGPRRVFFNADGTSITPGNYSSTGGAVRQKPDITAADGVNTSLDDFAPFFGTSAAAPHAAAIAALVLSGNPGATTADVREAFDATAFDLTPAGVDGRTGHGLIRADRVLAYTGATPQPLVRAGEATVTPTTGDGDAYLEPGERATVALPVTNVGDGTATGINVTVAGDDPQATVTPRARSYGNLAAGATRSRDFTLALAPGYPLGRRVSLAVRVTFAGVLSPTSGTIAIPTGEPGTARTTFAYDGPPVAIPDANAAGASVAIPVSGIGYASKLTFSIGGDTCSATAGATTVGLDHTFIGDLIGTLTGPHGQTATLFRRSGAGGNNLCQVVFDDAAERAFSSVTSGLAPFTGTWRPVDPLSGLLVDAVDGTWTVKVVDAANADTGSIRAAALHVTGFVSDG